MSDISTIIPGGFDSSAVEPSAPRDNAPLPAGAYTAEITSAEIKDLKSGNGIGLALEFTVIDPEQFARRKVWQNLNIKHTNPQAQEIGLRDLSALCRAVGVGTLKDSAELFGKVLRINTRVKPASGGYEAKAEVSSYAQAGAGPVPQAAPPAAAARPASGGAKPWQKAA